MILIDFLVRERLENLGKLQGELFLIVFVILFLGKLRCVFVVCSLCLRCVFVVCSLCVRLCIKLVY